MKRETDREGGFTRVDALVTITVITMIVTTSLAALVPAMNKAREAAMRARCANQMRQIGAAIAMYADAYDGALPFYGGFDPNYPGKYCGDSRDEDTHPYTAYRAIPDLWLVDGKPVAMKLACLYEEGIITDARIFYCPANIDEMFQYESYINPPPWGSLPQEWGIRTASGPRVRLGYTYFPVDETIPMEESASGLIAPKWTARRYDGLDMDIPYLADVLWFRKTMSHKTESGYSLNALFKDGHVVYCKDRRFFSDNPDDDPQELWRQWDPDAPRFTGRVKFNFFYYNFLKKIAP